VHPVYSPQLSKLGTQLRDVVVPALLLPLVLDTPQFSRQSDLSFQQTCTCDLAAATSSFHHMFVFLAPLNVQPPNLVRTMGTPHILGVRSHPLSRIPGNRGLSTLGLPATGMFASPAPS
jgi:hypothetical protein